MSDLPTSMAGADATNPKPTVSALPATAGVAEGMSLLQKIFFIALVTGCVAVYRRLNQTKPEDVQGYEKSLV